METNQRDDLPRGIFVRDIPNGSDYVDWSATPEKSGDFSFGEFGLHVAELQRSLQILGLYEGSINGKFEVETQSAVQRFQREHNLSATGTVDRQTWRRIKNLTLHN
jgi:peptidoglycan hydrolase-like protein with peptidoglycan-binding domain